MEVRSLRRGAVFFFLCSYLASGCTGVTPKSKGIGNLLRTGNGDPAVHHLTIIGTNDIHGGIEEEVSQKDPTKKTGGMAFLAGAIQSIRNGIADQYGANTGVLVLDAGDQFQGTLVSNYTEGETVIDAMNEAGYDAAAPGNHSYDFGPAGWLEDRVTPTSVDRNPRGVIETLAKRAKYPFISANTYLKDSLVDEEGKKVQVDSDRCKVLNSGALTKIDWSQARRPEFLTPYAIKNVAGLRVALIGLDHPLTRQMTTGENVSDLCFRDELESYEEIRTQLEGKADVFVLVIHDGNSNSENPLRELLQNLTTTPHWVDAVVSGHTHVTEKLIVNNVHSIQSGSGGLRFGRIDLVWDPIMKKILTEKSRSYAGVLLHHSDCDTNITSFCKKQEDGTVAYEGVTVRSNPRILEIIKDTRAKMGKMVDRELGFAEVPLERERILESSLANILADSLRDISGAQISFLNTGGIRDRIPSGPVKYEHLFKVMPFNNHAVAIGPMKWKAIKSLLLRSIQSCGSNGVLMQSGLKVKFKRHCPSGVPADTRATLERVESLSGEVLLDTIGNGSGPIEISLDRQFIVGTLDFLHAGGSGFDTFIGTPLLKDLGIFRELLAENFSSSPRRWDGKIDGRWINLP